LILTGVTPLRLNHLIYLNLLSRRKNILNSW